MDESAKRFIGIFPYLYFLEPLQVGKTTFTPASWGDPTHWPETEEDRHHLKNLLRLFADGLGRRIGGATYIMVDAEESKANDILSDIQNVLTLLRFSLLSPLPGKEFCFEQTYFYVFELPPIYENEAEEKTSYCYKCLINLQEEEYPYNGFVFYPPVPDLRIEFVSLGDFDNLDLLLSNFYSNTINGLTISEKEDTLIAMDWYNQTFQKSPVRDERGKIVDMATAFEVLLDLPGEGISGAFRSTVETLLGRSPELHKWATAFYDARSKIVHKGRAKTLFYKHPEATEEHVHLVWTSQLIFRRCVEAMLKRQSGFDAREITDLLTPNEVHLRRLREAGNFEEIQSEGLLKEIGKLRAIPPAGKREDIIGLGKLLLQAYKERYLADKQALPTVALILNAKDDDKNLGLKYYRFLEEFKPIYFRYTTESGEEIEVDGERRKVQRISTNIDINNIDIQKMSLETAIYHFANYAGWALSALMYLPKK